MDDMNKIYYWTLEYCNNGWNSDGRKNLTRVSKWFDGVGDRDFFMVECWENDSLQPI